MNELRIEARIDNLSRVLAFVDEQLEMYNCSHKALVQIEIAVEEIFVNIAHYAYKPKVGAATIKCEVTKDPFQVLIEFQDNGYKYNPLEKEDPDVTLGIEERSIGGLGIYMVKKSMSQVDYRYEDGKNILTMKKIIDE